MNEHQWPDLPTTNTESYYATKFPVKRMHCHIHPNRKHFMRVWFSVSVTRRDVKARYLYKHKKFKM